MSAMTHYAPDAFANGLSTSVGRLPGDASLRAFRTACIEYLEREGVPTTRHEDWKYTDLPRAIAPWWDALLTKETSDALLDASVINDLAMSLNAMRLVFVDGRFHAGLSDTPIDENGIYVGPVGLLLDASPDWLKPELSELESPLYQGMNAINGALFCDGLAVHVPAGIRLEQPVHAIFLSGEGQASHTRQHISLGVGACATVIEHYASIGDGGLDNSVSNVQLADDSKLTHYHLRQHGTKQVHIGRVHVCQQAGCYLGHAVCLGARFSRIDLVADLAKKGGHCELNGLTMTAGREHADCHTRIDHRAPDCTSREFFKGVLDGHSHSVFNGKIVVHKDAQHTDSAQSNANLILSKLAEIDTKPELEIYADDVKCAHGATVGQLDPKQVFYLRSRGLSEQAARQALTVAFADEVLARMPDAGVRTYLERSGLSRLTAADEVLA